MTARQEISRDPFGKFAITFKQCLENGAVVAEIENADYPILNRTAIGYESFEKAVSAIAEYFEEIDERAKKVSKNVRERAKRASQYIIAEEIRKIEREV